jgi:hypothetical protein
MEKDMHETFEKYYPYRYSDSLIEKENFYSFEELLTLIPKKVDGFH